MPITAAIEPDVLVLSFRGVYDNPELERVLRAEAANAPGQPVLIDASGTSLAPEPAETAERLAVLARFMPPLRRRVALVVADARRYAIGKVVQSQAEGRGIALEVFGAWQVRSARLWLNRESDPATTPVKPQTILLVEDEDGYRAFMAEVLTAQGYAVLEARTGAEALELAVLNRGSVDLLLTDLMMPVMNGRELALEFRRLYPGCRVLFASGYGAAELVQGGVLNAETPVLQKPFDSTGLLGKVREVLGRR